MEKPMTRFDHKRDDKDRVKDPVQLSPEDEERILERTVAVMRGRMRGWVALNWILTLAWGLVAAWAATAFFGAGTTRDWILYSTAFVVSAIAVSMLKIWFWMEMNRHVHTREIKRLELQVARIAQAIRDRP
jgi:hypothetical protein